MIVGRANIVVLRTIHCTEKRGEDEFRREDMRVACTEQKMALQAVVMEMMLRGALTDMHAALRRT